LFLTNNKREQHDCPKSYYEMVVQISLLFSIIGFQKVKRREITFIHLSLVLFK
jgi:hypothetical protein